MKARIVGGALFLVCAGLSAYLLSGRPLPTVGPSAGSAGAASKPPEALPVTVLHVVEKPLDTKLVTNGVLRNNESVGLTPEVTRRLKHVHVQEGQRVKKGDLLFELEAVDLVARHHEAQVRHGALAILEARQKKLLAEGVTSQNDYDRAKNDLDIAAAAVAVVAADLERTRVRAPFDGKIGLMRVSEGAMVGPGFGTEAVLVALEDDSRVKVDFTVPERFSPHLAVGAPFTFRTEGGVPLSGKVMAIEPRLDERTGAVRLRGLSEPLDPARLQVFAGQHVSVELELHGSASIVMVPAEIVTPSLGGHSVFVVEEGAAKPRTVELGIRTETEVAIVKGLVPGDLVITNNLVKLRPGMKVKVGEDPP
jgi:membrane fusion protein, multidrug efflux system